MASKIHFRRTAIAGAPAPAGTIGYGSPGTARIASALATVVGIDPGGRRERQVDPRETLVSDALAVRPVPEPAAPLPAERTADPFSTTADLPRSASTNVRSTVLPKIVLSDGEAEPTLEIKDRPRYRETRLLGEGGIGEVTLATDEDIGRDVAIKRLKGGSDSATLMRFVDEVQVMGRLDHPNIVPVHDVGADQHGRLYFVMKRLEGETLEAIIERLRDGDTETHAHYPIAVRVEIFMGVLRAVQFAHAQRVIHRDIKPANVMVGAFGEVAVVDWGIAKRLDDPISAALDAAAPPPDEDPGGVSARRPFRTRVGTLLGTPAYMSPEQARGDNHLLDERSDVFSLSVLFYELLTLSHPFGDAETLPEVLEAVRTREPLPAAIIAPKTQAGVSMELSNFVQTGLAKQREARFASVGEMIEELHAIAEGRFPITCPTTLLKSGLTAAMRQVDAYPRAAAMSVVATVLVALGAFVWLVVHLVA